MLFGKQKRRMQDGMYDGDIIFKQPEKLCHPGSYGTQGGKSYANIKRCVRLANGSFQQFNVVKNQKCLKKQRSCYL